MNDTDALLVTRVSDRPQLAGRVYEIADTWPPFTAGDLLAASLLGRVVHDFPDYCVVATDGDRVVARGLSVPFNAELEGREELPDRAGTACWAGRPATARPAP